MVKRPVQEAGDVDWSTSPGREWLGPELWDHFASIRNAKGRVAQESVPPSIISAWADSTA
jgi:hypothetical protein